MTRTATTLLLRRRGQARSQCCGATPNRRFDRHQDGMAFPNSQLQALAPLSRQWVSKECTNFDAKQGAMLDARAAWTRRNTDGMASRSNALQCALSTLCARPSTSSIESEARPTIIIGVWHRNRFAPTNPRATADVFSCCYQEEPS